MVMPMFTPVTAAQLGKCSAQQPVNASRRAHALRVLVVVRSTHVVHACLLSLVKVYATMRVETTFVRESIWNASLTMTIAPEQILNMQAAAAPTP